MSDRFLFDVFISHSFKDKAVVRPLAERLRADGLRVWFDEWEISPGDSISWRIEDGLEHSRVLVFCMSKHAFGSDWSQLEAGTFRFRDPLNEERLFIPLRLDDAPIRSSLAKFLYIDWQPTSRGQDYDKLLEACRPSMRFSAAEAEVPREQTAEKNVQFEGKGSRGIKAYAISQDGSHVLTCSDDKTLRLWDVETERCLRVLEGHTEAVSCVAWSADQRRAISGSDDKMLRLWDVETGRCLRVLEGHAEAVSSLAWSSDQHRTLSGSDDKTLRLWDVDIGRCLRVFEGHTEPVRSVVWSADQRRALSGSDDKTLRLWDVETGRCLRTLEGHTEAVSCVAWSADQMFALSGAWDGAVRLWNVEMGRCLYLLKGQAGVIVKVAWSADQRYSLSGNDNGRIGIWDLTKFFAETRSVETAELVMSETRDEVRYTSAKVLFVGESAAGKTSLSRRLALGTWESTDSTVAAWATQWKLPIASADDVEREIWLWDFGGQADYRLIHQLYMADAALAVLVFDGQREDLFETIDEWDRDLTRASRQAFTKLLVAGRVDVGGLCVKRSEIEAFARERGFSQFIETSAKTNLGCQELSDAILAGINWSEMPWRSSPRLFKRLRQEIIRLKDEGRVLMQFNELSNSLRLRMAGEGRQFKDKEVRAAIGLLAGAGIVWELAFGSWVLFQPEWINSYAQAVIRTLRADEDERGCISEDQVLSGTLIYPSAMRRLDGDDERFVLLAMHQMLVDRGLCLREQTDQGALLIFPRYYRQERPLLVAHPTVLVSFRFTGLLDDIFATLVVRLHYTKSFERDQLWRYAADFKTLKGEKLGVKLTHLAGGSGELDVYCDPVIPAEEKIIFGRYVHEHLLQKATSVERLRHYVCPHCGTPVGNREVAMERLRVWLEHTAMEGDPKGRVRSKRGTTSAPTIICSNCEKRVPLWDEIERSFASTETKQKVQELQEQSAIVLDNESKQLLLEGEVISTVTLAGQICRKFSSSDHGINMEIEFRDDTGQATGRKLYLQVKSGDSYLLKRKRDGVEVFTIRNERHARYWMRQPFPVMLVIRNSDGEIRWMEVREWLIRTSKGGKEPIKQVVFDGERFDVMSVRRWREPLIEVSRESLTIGAAQNPDWNVRLSSLERLAASWPDETTRALLFQSIREDSHEPIRLVAVKKLVSVWPDERTRDFLLEICKTDLSAEVLVLACETLSSAWWKDLGVRNWLRSRMIAEPEDNIRSRLVQAIHNAGQQVSSFWEARLSGKGNAAQEPETLPGYPAFRISHFRLRDIGPFHDTQQVSLHPGVNVFLGDNAAGKTTVLRCLALAAIGPMAANEVEDAPAAYVRKGAQLGTIEVLFELIPDPYALPAEIGHFSVGLQITAGSSRFAPTPDSEMSLRRPGQTFGPLPNSAEFLGALRSDRPLPFGFIAGYGAVRTFSESRFSIQTEAKKRENEWVLSLFKPDAPLVNPEVFSKLIRGDTSNIEDAPSGLPSDLVKTLGRSVRHLFPEVEAFFTEGDNDVQLNGTSLRFGELSDGYRSLFALLGHLLRCSLKVRSWNDDPSLIDGILLVDELDLHLHPEWQHHVVGDFRKTFCNTQLVASSHSPLIVGALKQEHVLLFRREEDDSISIDHPEYDPQGLGVAGILTNIFNLSSTIDQPTLDKINRRLMLHSKGTSRTVDEGREYSELADQLAQLGFNREFCDPYFERFATAMARRHKIVLEKLTPKEKLDIDAYADQLLGDVTKEESR